MKRCQTVIACSVHFALACLIFASGPARCEEAPDDENLMSGRAVIYPQSGNERFWIPVTTWSTMGAEIDFHLIYNSDSLVDVDAVDTPLETPNFAGLSQRNDKWSHDFVQWLDFYRDEEGAERLVRHHGGWHSAFDKKAGAQSVYVHESDGETQKLTGKGTITQSPQCNDEKKPLSFPASFVMEGEDSARYVYDKVVTTSGNCTVLPHYLLTRIEFSPEVFLTVKWSGADTPHVTSVTDPKGAGITFTFTDGLLTSIKDAVGRVHTLSYTGVPDENGVKRKKLAGLTTVGTAGKTYKWTFGYRNEGSPGTGYSGTYTGDLVIEKRQPDGTVTYYEYEPVKLTGAPPHVKRTKPEDWDGRAVKIHAFVNEYGVKSEEVYTRKQIAPNKVRMTYPHRPAKVLTYEGDKLVDETEEE